MAIPDLSRFKYDPGEETKPVAVPRKRAREDDDHETKRVKEWPGPLPPILRPGLKLVFVGFNPGIESGKRGHHYAHGSNRFWKMLFWSGLTPTLHSTVDDKRFPELYDYGFTDLVARSTKGIQQLSKEEMAAGVDLLDARLAEAQPSAVCLVGKGIWEAIARARKWDVKKFRYGLDPDHLFGGGHAKLYCVPSTSGLNSISSEKQLASWAELKADLEAESEAERRGESKAGSNPVSPKSESPDVPRSYD